MELARTTSTLPFATGGSSITTSAPPAPPAPVDKLSLGATPAAMAPPVAPASLGSVATDVKKTVGKLAGYAKAAVAVVPTVGSLVAARELAKVEGVLDGKHLSALSWLQNRLPSIFTFDMNEMLPALANVTSDAVGLSPSQLVDVDRNLYKMLAPTTDANGTKVPPLFMRQLGQAALKDPSAPYAAYVYLGEGKEKQSQAVMDLWNSPNRPTTNPYAKTDPNYAVWDALQQRVSTNDYPVFIDLDGDPTTFTTTEELARQTVSSLWQAGAKVGGAPTDAGLYYAWLTQRLDANYNTLDPWMAKNNSQLHADVATVKQDLNPAWLGGKGVGPYPPADKVDDAFSRFKKLADGKPADFADAAISMDRDIITGVQTNWIKLMRETGASRREQLFKPMADAWINLALGDGDQSTPPGAPMLTCFESTPTPHTVDRPYDRAMGMGEVISHTLDGLGINERKQFMGIIREQLQAHQGQLEQRDQQLRQELGSSYSGVDVAACIDGTADPSTLKPLQAQLEKPVNVDQAKAARFWDLMNWGATSAARYGDIDLSLSGNDPAFSKDPLAVSEFFSQSKQAAVVSPLGTGPQKEQTLGVAQSGTPPTKVSMVFAGGGGKGFAYVGCLQQLQDSLATTHANLAIDQYVGNSAGAITAGLLAAGYKPDEMADVMKQLDFTKFTADAVSLEGGTDPKVRGIDRTGMFSMQKMYTSIYDLMSKKLGIEGRPILFSDLPYKFRCTSTVLDTNLPKDDPIRKSIAPDGRIVMSSEGTPNFDVVGAIVASAAVPGFFNSPQMEVFRGKQPYHIQFCDGGCVDNFPVTETDPAQAMVVMPAHTEAVDPKTGQTVALSTLNFDDSDLGVINDHNKALYQSFTPQLGKFLTDAKLDRAVFAFNLSTQATQPLPVIQGKDAATTQQLVSEAQKDGVPELSIAAGQKLTEKLDHAPALKTTLGGAVFAHYLQVPGASRPLDWHLNGSTYTPGDAEADNIISAGTGAGGAVFAAIHRPFEQV